MSYFCDMDKAEKEYKKRLQWFIDRIGKRVYRNETSCKCKICKAIGVHGLIISDEMHAHYLNDCSAEMDLQYRDKP